MRITNWKHLPWFLFVLLATIAACLLYIGNFYPDRMPAEIRLPPSLIQIPTEHHTVGGTPLGLAFGAISLAIFVFAALLSLRKKVPLWRIGTVQRWLRAHIWLTLLTIPLVLLHSGFHLGGPMTTLLMVLYAIVMVSGIYGLILQHVMPRLMKERLPAETVFEQIPHIRAQLCVAAEKMRDSFKPAPPKNAEVSSSTPLPTKTPTGSAVMAATKGELSTPVARAKSVTGSAITAAPVATAAPGVVTPEAKVAESTSGSPPDAVANAAAKPAAKAETVSDATPTTGTVAESPAPATPPKPAPSATPKPPPAKPVAAAKAALPVDPASEEALVEFIDRQILPFLRARRGERFRLGKARFSDDTFRFLKLRVADAYRSRVEEIQGWCDERRMLDLQTRLHHWLHGWLLIHVPFSFLLLMLTVWHAYVTLFY